MLQNRDDTSVKNGRCAYDVAWTPLGATSS